MKKLILAVVAMLSIRGTAHADQSAVSMINELLRGEISAVETYRQAMEKVGTVPGAEMLRKNHEDHVQAVKVLQELVLAYNGTPATDSGAWGTWAQTVVGSAKLLGDTSALKALKEGEQHGVKEYEEAVKNENVPMDVKKAIQEKLLPSQRAHIEVIDALMKKS